MMFASASVWFICQRPDVFFGRKHVGTYFSAEVLIWYYNHIGWISDSCGSPSNVGEDYFSNQDMSGVKIKHLTQPAKSDRDRKAL